MVTTLSAAESLKVAVQHIDEHAYVRAESVCRQALEAFGPSPALARVLGIALLHQKKPSEAAPYLKMALAAAPEPDLARFALPQLFAAGEWEAFITMCTEDVLPREQPAALLKMIATIGTAYLKLGRMDLAGDQFRRCLKAFMPDGVMTRRPDKSELNTLFQAAIGARDETAVAQLAEIHTPAADGVLRTMAISDVTPLRAACERERAPIQILDPEQYVALPPAGYAARECWAATLSDASVIAGWDWPIAFTGEVLDGANYMPFRMMFGVGPYFHIPDLERVAYPWPKVCVDVDADAVFLSSPGAMHFGHWLVDFLPRLRAWKRPMKIAVPAWLPEKHRDTIACFGATADDLVECEPGKRYRFRSLTVVVTGNHKEPQPAGVKFVSKGLAALPGRKERRIFVHRAVGTRAIANQGEFDALLAAYGFAQVDLASMSIAEQRAMMAEAGIVLGVHGSDLFCMYMTPPETDIVELVWVGLDDPVFARSAAILGMRHHFVRCAEAPAAAFKKYKKDRDIVVDCTQLGAGLDAIIEARKASKAL